MHRCEKHNGNTNLNKKENKAVINDMSNNNNEQYHSEIKDIHINMTEKATVTTSNADGIECLLHFFCTKNAKSVHCIRFCFGSAVFI